MKLDTIKQLAEDAIKSDYPADMEWGVFGAAEKHEAAWLRFHGVVTPQRVIKLIERLQKLEDDKVPS